MATSGLPIGQREKVVVIGAGHAGLSISHELCQAGVEHIVFERARVGEAWRRRWDSFCLVTPNQTVLLPGGHYAGSEPNGFMPRDAFVDHLTAYARRFGAPLHENVNVSQLDRNDGAGFLLRTSMGEIRADHVVLASGAYQKPHRPKAAAGVPASLQTIDAENYTNPQALPPGPVLVVGSGQTGCQLAEELFEAGRDTYIACGRAPWVPRRLEGRDIVMWLLDTPFMDNTITDLPNPAARLIANIQISGQRGGHDLNHRTLKAMGVKLLGHLAGFENAHAFFASDLADSIAFGDERYTAICEIIRSGCKARSVKAPDMPPPGAFTASAPEKLDLTGFGAVIFTSGFRPDYTSWVRIPEAFDDFGFPIQESGSSTVVPGLHFMGVHFQRKRKSATLYGAAEDAAVLTERIAHARADRTIKSP